MKPNPSKKISSDYPVQPQVAVGAIVFNDSRVLLVQRGKAPALGLWSIPGGSVELGETLQRATEREIREETGLTIKAREPVFTFDVIDRDESGRVRFHYVIVDLMADYISGELRAGDDALDARWVSSGETKSLNMSEKARHLLTQKFGFGE
ncbi:NUDIX hydrolase [Thermodesulfobacteriota bacterium]